MRYITYEWIHDENSGIDGFWPVNTPLPEGFYPCSPLGLAHDLLEHQNGFAGMGSFEDEMEALGGILFVRGYFGQNHMNDQGYGNNCVYKGVAEEVINLYEMRDWLDMRISIKTTLGEEAVDDAVAIARETIEGEEYLRLARLYMMRGYNKAHRRFKGNQYLANNSFFDLIESIKELTKYDPEQGQRFRLAWSLGDFKFYQVEDEYYEY